MQTTPALTAMNVEILLKKSNLVSHKKDVTIITKQVSIKNEILDKVSLHKYLNSVMFNSSPKDFLLLKIRLYKRTIRFSKRPHIWMTQILMHL